MSTTTQARRIRSRFQVDALGLLRRLLTLESTLYSVITPMLPHFARVLPASKPELGVLAGAYTAGLIPGALLGGWLSTRIGVRRTTLAGTLVFAVAVPAFGFATTLLTLDALRFVQGIACGCLWGGALTWVIAAAPEGRRGEMVGTAFSAAIVGTLIGPVLGVIAVQVSPELVFTVMGVVTLIGAGLLLRTDEPSHLVEENTAPLRALLSMRPALMGVWLTLLEALTFGALYLLLPLALAALGASAVEIGIVFLGSSVLAVFVVPRVGVMCDRHGVFPVLAVALAGSAALMALLALPMSPILLGAVAVVLMGAPLCGFLVPAVSLISDASETVGVALAASTMLVNLAYALGETIGSPASAAITRHGDDAVVMLGLAALMLLTLIPLARMRRRA